MRRTMLAAGLLTITSIATAQTALQVKQSFKNTTVYLLSNASQFLSPSENYFNGTRQYFTDNAQSFFVPYGTVDYVYPNKISVTAPGEWTGECVAFVKGVTTQWFSAANLIGSGNFINTSTPVFSVIGVFGESAVDDNGYASYSYSHGHLAIYLGANSGGIVVMDQNHDNGRTMAIHTIPWYSSSSDRRMSAANYRIVVNWYLCTNRREWDNILGRKWEEIFLDLFFHNRIS